MQAIGTRTAEGLRRRAVEAALPENKRQDLQEVLKILVRAFDDAIRNRTSARKQGRILKVILFGSRQAREAHESMTLWLSRREPGL